MTGIKPLLVDLMGKEREFGRYFNFPIQLLKGFLVDREKSLENILVYAVFQKVMYFKTTKIEMKHLTEIKIVPHVEKYFQIELNDYCNVLNKGETIYFKYHSGSPKTKIKIDTWLDYYKNPKSEFQKIVLLAHLALLSTIKKKPYARVDKFYLYSRMDGQVRSIATQYRSKYESLGLTIKYPDPNILESLSNEIRKYATHRYWDKIRTELEDNWYWNIPKKLPRMDKKGKLEIKQIRRANYFTQLDVEAFYKIIAREEELKYKKEISKRQSLDEFVAKYNSKYVE